jgi:hypothetical protein
MRVRDPMFGLWRFAPRSTASQIAHRLSLCYSRHMARKPVQRSLPTLSSLHPRFREVDPRQNVSAVIATMLRETIERVRTPRTIPFYSVREAAAFFGVSSRTMANVYERLEAEGLLTRIRSSQTVLPGRRLQSRHPVRGVVGIPIALPAFVFGTTLRSFYIRFEEELRRQHFVADLIFYREEDEARHPAELVERVLEHQLDFVLWVAPSKAVASVMQQLQDGGIQLVIVSDGKARFLREQYFVDLERGITDGLAAWQADGIQTVAVLGPDDALGRWEIAIVTRLLKRRGMKHEVFTLGDAETAQQLDELACRSGQGVVLVPHHWYESLCDQFPDKMERLFRSCPVLLMQGALAHGYFRGKHLLVDSVTWPYEQMARRIARDISERKVATTTRLATFSTRWQPRLNLGNFSRELWTGPWVAWDE